MTQSSGFIPYNHTSFEESDMLTRARNYYEWLDTRRSVRDFSNRAIPRAVIEHIILSASTSPSGAHKQPWTFCAVADPAIKSAIRQAAEQEEYASYHGRMSDRWLKDLQPLGTDWQKPYLEIAPWLLIVFKKVHEHDESGRHNNYYVNESVGLACGMLLTAIHHAGLVALTHTPSPMNFLTTILQRPDNERPFLLIPVGYPAENTVVPDLRRKSLDEVSVFYEG